VETRTESHSITVKIEHGYRVEITSPENGTRMDGSSVTVSGSVTNWDGTPLGKQDAEVTIYIGETPTTIELGEDGSFSREVLLNSGQNDVHISVSDGTTTATSSITIWNAALPETYCVAAVRFSDAVSVIDPLTNSEVLRLTDAQWFDQPRDLAFVDDGSTLVVLNSPGNDETAFLTAMQFGSIEESLLVGEPLDVGEGSANWIDVTPDGETLVVPLHKTEDGATTVARLYTIDVHQPDEMRIADYIDMPADQQHDTYGPRDVATGNSQDGRTIALVTLGDLGDNGPSPLLLYDISNPYNIVELNSVPIHSRPLPIAIRHLRRLSTDSKPAQWRLSWLARRRDRTSHWDLNSWRQVRRTLCVLNAHTPRL